MTFCRMCPGSSGVEQWTENPRVGGSNPPPGTTFKKINLSFIIKIVLKMTCAKRHSVGHLPMWRRLKVVLWLVPKSY